MSRVTAAQIFLSGTSDLNPFKRKAQQIAEYLGRSAWMDIDHRSPGPPREVCLEKVRCCERFFLFLGARYGEIQPGLDLSPTEDEYEQARLLGKPIYVFIQDVPVDEERQIAFLDRVGGYTTGHWRWPFKNLDEVRSLIEEILAVDPPKPGDLTLLPAVASTRWQRSRQRIERLFPQTAHKLNLPETLPVPRLDLDDLRPTPDFIGREDQLEKIAAGLTRNLSTNIYAVHGLGGVGKSELAKQVALRLQRENALADGAIWVRLTTGRGTAAWDQIARSFEIDLSILDNTAEKLAILKEILHAVSPLIILDNADDPESLDIACQPLDGKTLLITSRQRVGAVQVIDLEDLPLEQAEDLYWTIYTQQLGSEGDAWRRANHQLALREIVTRLGGHPLSIEIIASKAGIRSWSPEESVSIPRQSRGL